MPLTFPTDFDFIGVTTQPRQQFVLDQITRHWKSNAATEEEVLAATNLPAVGDAHPSFTKMFVASLSTAESGDNACVLSVNYIGCIATDGGGNAVLPAQKHSGAMPVQSATTSYGSFGSPGVSITIQYKAPTVILSYISADAPGTTDAADPTNDPVVVAVVVGGINFTPASIPDLLSTYFTLDISAEKADEEIVAGKYWQNTSKKIKGYLPYVVNIVHGSAIVGLSAPGADYRIGDILTISAGGEGATILVTALGLSQSILGYSVSSNTFTTPQSSLVATGGSGSGARFNVYILP